MAAQFEQDERRKKAAKLIVKSHRTSQIYVQVLPESWEPSNKVKINRSHGANTMKLEELSSYGIVFKVKHKTKGGLQTHCMAKSCSGIVRGSEDKWISISNMDHGDGKLTATWNKTPLNLVDIKYSSDRTCKLAMLVQTFLEARHDDIEFCHPFDPLH